jgi:hypothetical protein
VANTAGGGSILRWTGDATTPHQYEVVGNLDAESANLAEHDGRIFTTTWPGFTDETPMLAGIYVSPDIPAEGLTAADADLWEKVWDFAEYEPDPIVAVTYGGGAIASFGGYVYWGSMHVPLLSAGAWSAIYGTPADPEEYAEVVLSTHRAISLYRGRLTPEGAFEAELLYGEWFLPVYNEAFDFFWPTLNNMGPPLFGESGFGNLLNNYTWTMQAYEDSLFVGTMDSTYLALDMGELLGLPPDILDLIIGENAGADLWRFDSPDLAAVAEDLNGLGNYTNYGIRTMISEDALYCGSANPMNLLTDPLDGVPEGGWELLRLRDCAPGDVNCDGVIDLADFVAFANCLAGPGVPHGLGCDLADIDGDGDVDAADFALFQVLFPS